MNFNELVETITKRPKTHPYFITLEGIIGSGKSYEAEKLKEKLAGNTILLSTDLFVTVGRDEWTERVEAGGLDLRDWYDLPKMRETLESIKRKEKFYIIGLYDLATGEFDDRVEVDARGCDYMILEGLFSCDELLDGLIDLKIFLDVPLETSINRAHERDETVRNLEHSEWVLKRTIFYDNYLPYLEDHRGRADVILEVD